MAEASLQQLKVHLKHVRRRAGRAMPPWPGLRKEIQQIYAQRPQNMVVDHIVPLADPKLGFNYYEGCPVCGLHVPWNLQIITQRENFLKTDPIQARKRGFKPGWGSPDHQGSANPNVKLTASQVLEIRARYTGAKGELTNLGREFGVTKQQIRDIVHRTKWKHI